MRVVVQRVRRASVRWAEAGGEVAREIGPGLAILVGAGPDDTEADAERLADKVLNLRIFADEAGKSNLSLSDIRGAALVVSQFTLYADVSRGRRPSFVRAGDPAEAARRYERFATRLADSGIEVATGSFGAEMTVGIENEGPFTMVLSSDPWDTRING